MPEAASTVVPDMERVVAEEPGRERAWSLLMRGLYASGRQHDALAAYQRARVVLGDEFGLEPGHELRTSSNGSSSRIRRWRDRAATPSSGTAARRRAARRPRTRARPGSARRGRVRVSGTGQVRAVLGPVGSGRTRLVAELAAAAIADGGAVEYVPGRDRTASALDRDRAGFDHRRHRRALPGGAAAARGRRRRVDATAERRGDPRAGDRGRAADADARAHRTRWRRAGNATDPRARALVPQPARTGADVGRRDRRDRRPPRASMRKRSTPRSRWRTVCRARPA